MAKLTFILDDGESIEVPLLDDITIGRLDGNDVVVDDPRISSRHAEVHRLPDGGFELRDLASKAGTTVNGERVDRRVLASGDKLSFGPLNGVFELDGVESTIVAPLPEPQSEVEEEAPKTKTKTKQTRVSSKRAKTGRQEGSGKAAKPVEAQEAPKTAAKGRKSTPALSLTPGKPERQADPPAVEETRLVAGTFARLEADAKTAIEELLATRRQLDSEVARIRSELAPLREEHRLVAQRCLEMKNAVSSEERRLNNLQAQAVACERQFSELIGEIHARTERIAALKNEERRLSHVTSELQDAESRQAEWLATMSAQSSDAFSRLEAESKESIERLKVAKKQIEGEIAQVRAELAPLQSEQQELSRKNAEIQHAIEGEQRRQESLRIQNEAAEKQLGEATSEIHSVSGRVSTLKAEEKRLAHVTQELKDKDGRHAALLAAIALLASEHSGKQAEVQRLQAGAEKAKSDLEKLGAEHAKLDTNVCALRTETESLTVRLEQMRVEEKRLAHVREELKDAESKHAGWLDAIKTLSHDYDTKNTEVERLTTSAGKALRELEAMTSNKEAMSVQLLSLLKEQETHEARLADLRKQTSEAESKMSSLKELADAREDQVKAAERKLQTAEQLRKDAEQRIKELSGTEEKLKQSASKVQAADAKHAALIAALAILATRQKSVDDQIAAQEKRLAELRKEQADFEAASTTDRRALEAGIAELKKNAAAEERALEEFRTKAGEECKRIESESKAAQTKAETERRQQESDKVALEKELETRRGELAAENKRLEEARAQRAELERQCQELADTSRKLTEARAGVQKVEAQRTELDSWIKDLDEKRSAVQKVLDDLHHEEEAAKGRLEVLRGREKDLRASLDQLSQREHTDRERFEEIRKLSTEAEKEHAARMEELQRTTDISRRELADIEMKLAPLREWKEAMEARYARLASLPEDSAEARELWTEIEAEKASLRNLITTTGKGTRGITLSEAVLRGVGSDDGVSGEPAAAAQGASTRPAKTPGTRGGRPGAKKGMLHAPAPIIEPETPEERAHVGPTGTGAMLSGTGQEMALKARLNRMRESVQREATRLEFLRQERAREETRGKAGSAAGEAILKEQERQLENKVRREEEKLAALERKLELAEMEEEKRRERIAEMERKLSELKSDIADHERDRSESLRAAEVARREVEALEDAAERLKTMGNNESLDGTRLPSSALAQEARPKLKPMTGAPPTGGA